MQAWSFFLPYLRNRLLHKQTPQLSQMRFALASLLSWEPSGFLASLSCLEKCRQKYSSYECRGYSLSAASGSCMDLYTPQNSNAPLCLVPCRLCESACEQCLDEPCGGCLSSHDGNHTRVLLSWMCHGVSILGNSCTNESLKTAACIKSRTCVWLWQGDGGWFAFQHGDGVLCSSLELFPCKAPALFAEAIPPWLCGEL